mmetsp:Transcript_28612/g.88725  ORF Transcript_28612/g.88725 Transcript_28612/m.88725 type:complete len:411 (-) Transcript_28612:1975-3207(-)
MSERPWKLDPKMSERYSRQMLVHGALAQGKLREASVLVVGAGALGCACLPYLVGSGVGRVTVCDGDTVETNNLHRQTLFLESDAGKNKAAAAAGRLRRINSGATVLAMARHCSYDSWTSRLVENHAVVVDCTDNVGTRYLLNDACHVLNKVLISAAALKSEGSLTRWCTPGSACYRCVAPRPLTHEARRQCIDQGVLGPVPGMLGALQALDILRCLSSADSDGISNKIYLFNGLALHPYELPPQRRSCELCGEAPTIISLQDSKQWAQSQGLGVNYNSDPGSFGAMLPPLPVPLPPGNEITVLELKAAIYSAVPFVLVDVREETQFSICRVLPAVSLPLRQILESPNRTIASLSKLRTADCSLVLVLCRRGLDSRAATKALLRLGFSNTCNIAGGLDAWRRDVDAKFPVY